METRMAHKASTTDKELIEEWGQKIRRAENFRKRIYSDNDYTRYEGYFRNKTPNSTNKNHAWMLPKKQRATSTILADEARKQVPKIIFDTPYVKVANLAGREPVHAKILERTVNGLLDGGGAKKHLKKAVLSAIQHGTGFLKIGYDSEFVPDYASVQSFGFSEGAFDEKGVRREFRDDVFPGMPWIAWQHTRNVILPEMLADFSEARWCAFRYFRNVADAKQDTRLKNTEDLQPVAHDFHELDPDLSVNFTKDPSVRDVALFTEVRDKETGMMYIFAEGHNKVLYQEKDVLMEVLGGKLPLVPVVFNFNTDYVWGTSDIDLMEDKFKELIDIRTQAAKARRISIAKFVYRKGSIERSEIEKLVSGDVAAGVEVEGNIESTIKEFKMSNDQSLFNEAAIIEDEIKTHFGSNAFANNPSSRRVSGEVSGAQGDASIPIEERIAVLNDVVKDIGMSFANIVFAFWPEETVVDILAPVTEMVPDPMTGQMMPQDITKQVWVAFTGHELQGNFDYTISTSAGRFQDSRQAKAEALEIVNFVGQIEGANMPELMKQLGDRFHGIDFDKVFPVQQQPQAQPQALAGMLGGGQQQQQGMTRKQPQMGS